MNRSLPPRDRGNRVADSLRALRSAGALFGAFGLVGRTKDLAEPKKPPGKSRRQRAMIVALVVYAVGPLPVLSSEGLDLQPQLFGQCPAHEAANRVSLPAR